VTLVSAIVPAYNAARFIEATIQSILAQTHSSIEIIVIDDGSTDKTPAILEKFKNDLTVITQKNLGVAAARNMGAKTATGDFLAFLDADDLWRPEKISCQLDLTLDADMVYSDRTNFGQLGGLATQKSDANALLEGMIHSELLTAGNFITLSSVLIRTSLFHKLGGFNEARELSGVEDWELWLRVAKTHKIAVANKPLVEYRIHADGISKNVPAMFAAQERVLNAALRDEDTGIAKTARANSASTSAWFSQNSRNFAYAFKLHLRALRFRPMTPATYKQLAKCLLRRP
jgi:teichuronic acid biosynthesis glycosyltransferase TuaG